MAAQSSRSGQPSPFITDEEFERLRSRTAVSGEQEDSKGSIPDMVPGFKASPLTIGVPPKIIRAFKAFDYVPYTSLTATARLKAEQEQELEWKADGSLAAKRFDWLDETAITDRAWQAAARLAVELARQHWPQGAVRAEALIGHHDVVTRLAESHGWQIAVRYDIRQRDTMHRVPQHDISTLSDAALTYVSSQVMTFGIIRHCTSFNHGEASADR
ncbi:hypothetical protein M422DRAFT_780220 [Sphaerobolus stellatus SS14]|uniref:Uncharacterized protein n=1 Tax=Sphaerobolus stellatus (strain SS14) TaxID=990650 RepID=A0A0C9VUC9_SPHS4|nr:hypothetical protein M422DRAFT_780220 [Sphaerobolus stellatus SS14]